MSRRKTDSSLNIADGSEMLNTNFKNHTVSCSDEEFYYKHKHGQ